MKATSCPHDVHNSITDNSFLAFSIVLVELVPVIQLGDVHFPVLYSGLGVLQSGDEAVDLVLVLLLSAQSFFFHHLKGLKITARLRSMAQLPINDVNLT